MKLHDVSVLISEELPIWPGDPEISMALTSSLISLGNHSGIVNYRCLDSLVTTR